MLPTHDTWTRATQIDVPVHAVNGAIDAPDHLDMAARLVDTIGTGRTITIEDTAHYPNMGRPDQCNDALRDLLRTL